MTRMLLTEQASCNVHKTFQMFCVHIALETFAKKLAKDIYNIARKKQKKDKSRVPKIICNITIINFNLKNQILTKN